MTGLCPFVALPGGVLEGDKGPEKEEKKNVSILDNLSGPSAMAKRLGLLFALALQLGTADG